MKTWLYKINQWSVWQRSVFLCLALFILFAFWYLCLEKPLLKNNQTVLEQQARDQVFVSELTTLLGMQSHFIYQDQLHAVQFKQVFQDALSGVPGLTLTKYVDNPVISLPAGAGQFAQSMAVFNLPLLNSIQQVSATLIFSGGFDDAVAYLKVLQQANPGIYFDSLDFNMNRYPNAEITLKVFALEGGA